MHFNMTEDQITVYATHTHRQYLVHERDLVFKLIR